MKTMKTLSIIVLSILIFSTSASAYRDHQQEYLRYNPLEDRYEYAGAQDYLRYNPIEDEWSYESSDSYLKYNPMEDRFEYTD